MTSRIDKSLQDRFSTVFSERLWGGGAESVSGPGSCRDNPMVEKALSGLVEVIDRFGIASIADIPCGDFNFIGDILESYPGIKYAGYDIVEDLVRLNSERNPGFEFCVFDIVSDVPPKADLVFCKELLIHLGNEDINKALSNIRKSGAKYFMASNSFGVKNEELEHNYLGYARPIDLLAEPFTLPAALWRNAFYALWRCEDIPVFETERSLT